MKRKRFLKILAGAVIGAGLMVQPLAYSHCDTLDGPVVQDARLALDRKDVTPVLKWVTPQAEAEIKAAFAQTLLVRTQSPQAQQLADRFFFETLVRVHRAGENAPFTGLKPAGSELEPGIKAADNALAGGSAEALTRLVTDDILTGIRKRFALVRDKQRHAEESVAAGREYVAAYVDYIHYVEGLHQAAQGAEVHSGEDHAGSSSTEAHAETTVQHHHQAEHP